MDRLAVLVRQHDAVVIERVCRLRDGMSLGSARGAAVAFPGAVLRVVEGPAGWSVGGRPLRRDRAEVFRLGDLEVVVEGVVDSPSRHVIEGVPDPRILVLTMAAVLVALSLDAALRVLDTHADLAAELQARVLGRVDADDQEGTVAVPDAPRRLPPVARLTDDACP